MLAVCTVHTVCSVHCTSVHCTLYTVGTVGPCPLRGTAHPALPRKMARCAGCPRHASVTHNSRLCSPNIRASAPSVAPGVSARRPSRSRCRITQRHHHRAVGWHDPEGNQRHHGDEGGVQHAFWTIFGRVLCISWVPYVRAFQNCKEKKSTVQSYSYPSKMSADCTQVVVV